MVDGGMNYLYTIGGYVTLIGASYVVYQISTQQQAKKRSAQAKAAKAAQPEPRKEDRKKKQRLEAFAQEAQESASKAAMDPADEKEPAAAAPVSTKADTVDESAANREFAKQLAKAKEGTKFAAKSDSKQREKSVKQSKANQMQTSANKAPLPVNEPVEAEHEGASNGAAAADIPVEAGRVDDMLEPTHSAPSVLRLTESTNPQPQQKKKAAKAPEKVETKKQRQNRKKAEAARAAREGAETERKALEEKQRRQARIAEGRAAKDGSQYTNGATAAWKQGAPNGASSKNETVHEPLDTFEPTAAAAPAPAKKQANSAVKSESSWASAIPSEEDQMKMLSNDDEWSTVKTKGSKKKATNGNSADESASAFPVATTRQSAPVKAGPRPTTGKAGGKAFGGSFSALTTNDTAAEDEEEEWDV